MMVSIHLTTNAKKRELMDPQSYGSRVTQATLNEPDGPSVAYLAGFFDGEGSIYATKDESSHIPHFLIQVITTRQEEPMYFKKRWGGSISHTEGQEENHSDSWQWQLSNEKARIAIEQMVPYLRGKKPEAELFLEAISYKLQERKGENTYPQSAREPLIEYANQIRGMSADRGGSKLSPR